MIELAKIGFNWQLAQGVLSPDRDLCDPLADELGQGQGGHQRVHEETLGGFIGRTIVTTDGAFKWAQVTVAGQNLVLPALENLVVQVNNINEYIPDTPGLFWQRFGATLGVDLSNPLAPLLAGANLGFTWGPRFKHDYLWFQELLSLDASGSLTVDPFSFTGIADLKAANATLVARGVQDLERGDLQRGHRQPEPQPDPPLPVPRRRQRHRASVDPPRRLSELRVR